MTAFGEECGTAVVSSEYDQELLVYIISPEYNRLSYSPIKYRFLLAMRNTLAPIGT